MLGDGVREVMGRELLMLASEATFIMTDLGRQWHSDPFVCVICSGAIINKSCWGLRKHVPRQITKWVGVMIYLECSH